MSKFYTVDEAATYLGLTPQTLRNWDKAGKIDCVRDPGSNYRLFSEDELNAIKRTVKPKVAPRSNNVKDAFELSTVADLKRLIAKTHRIVRDYDGRSSIIERFDELTKLFLLHVNFNGELNTFMQDVDVFAKKVRVLYKEFLSHLPVTPPANYEKINLNNQCIFSVFDYLSRYGLNNISGDVRGLIYEEMIKDIFEKGDNQQFFTPSPVVSFMSNLICTLTSGSICDPASGTGGFLINLVKNCSEFNDFTAFEIDERLAWVSGINLEMHGCKIYKSIYLPNGGTLGMDANKYKNTFDAIITNPPFGSDYSDSKGLLQYELGVGKSSRRRGVLFIERCLQFLKVGGYLAIIIDDGVLNHVSNEDVRKLITHQSQLLAVVSLPATTFMPYASVESSILIMRKVSNQDTNFNTFFALAENVGKKNNGDEDYIYDNAGQEVLKNDLVAIQEQWNRHIKGHKIHPSNSCYVSNIYETFQGDGMPSFRLDFAFHHYSREIVRNTLKKHRNKLVQLTELCLEINEPLLPAKEIPDQTILYTGLANIESNSEIYSQIHTPTNSIKSTVKKYKKGDVLFSKMRPNLRKCVAVTHDDNGYCSSECVVFRPNKEIINERMLSAILRSDFVYGQIVHLITGIGRPRVSIKDLRSIMIPIPSDSNKSKSMTNYIATIKKSDDLKNKSDELLRQAVDHQINSTNNLVNELLL